MKAIAIDLHVNFCLGDMMLIWWNVLYFDIYELISFFMN